MGIKTDWLRYGPDKVFSGFAAWEEKAALPLPAAIVFQEAWGVDAHIQDVTVRIAKAGYFAFAPDLFSKDGKRPEPLADPRMVELQGFVNTVPAGAWTNPAVWDSEIAKRPAAEGKRISESKATMMGVIGGSQDDQLVATTKLLRAEHAVTKGQPIGATGFCMGGARAVRLACLDPELAAAAIFYGNAPPEDLIPKINCPVLGFYGSEDERLVSALPAFVEQMKKHGKKLTPTVYKGAKHAFSNDIRPAYDVAATRDSWAKLLGFFRERLAPPYGN